MVGGELLVAFALGQRLCRLHEPARAIGKFLEIHISTPSAHDGAGKVGSPEATRCSIMWGHLSQFEEPACLM